MEKEIVRPGRYNRFEWAQNQTERTRVGIILHKDMIKAFRKKCKKDGFLMSDKIRHLIHKYLEGEI